MRIALARVEELGSERAAHARQQGRRSQEIRDTSGTSAHHHTAAINKITASNGSWKCLNAKTLAEREGFYYRHSLQLPVKPTLGDSILCLCELQAIRFFRHGFYSFRNSPCFSKNGITDISSARG